LQKAFVNGHHTMYLWWIVDTSYLALISALVGL
jgi:heme exporter protein D